MSLDRNSWQFGTVAINLLVLGIAYQGIAVPVCWMALEKKGNSNTLERIALLELFISLFGTACIDCLTADREFVGLDWFSYLQDEDIPFRIRIKRNHLAETNKGHKTAVSNLFQHLLDNRWHCPTDVTCGE